MGTRAVTKIEGLPHALYTHWDGYPSAKLPWLATFYSEFFSKRGFDDSYCLAQLIRSSVRFAEQFDLDESFETGYGIVADTDNCNQEYTYELMSDGSIKCNNVVVWKHGDKIPTKESVRRMSKVQRHNRKKT